MLLFVTSTGLAVRRFHGPVYTSAAVAGQLAQGRVSQSFKTPSGPERPEAKRASDGNAAACGLGLSEQRIADSPTSGSADTDWGFASPVTTLFRNFASDGQSPGARRYSPTVDTVSA